MLASLVAFLAGGTFRRIVAAGVAVGLPAVNAWLGPKVGVDIPEGATVASIITLAGYIAQSVANEIHARANPVTTVAQAAVVLSQP